LLPRAALGGAGVAVLGAALALPLPNVLVLLQARAQNQRLLRVAARLGVGGGFGAFIDPVTP
jgi:hypothetical protein